MWNRRTTAVASLVMALALSGCGSDPQTPPNGGTGPDGATTGPTPGGDIGGDVDIDAMDACTLLKDADLQAFFGGAPGKKTTQNRAFVKGCVYEDAAVATYVSFLVQAPPTGAEEQMDYNKSVSKNVADISGLGDEAFGWYDDDEANIEIRHRGVLVQLSRQAYAIPYRLEDPTEMIAKLVVLAKAALTRIS